MKGPGKPHEENDVDYGVFVIGSQIIAHSAGNVKGGKKYPTKKKASRNRPSSEQSSRIN